MRKTCYALFWTRRSLLLPFHLCSQVQDKMCAAARAGERIRVSSPTKRLRAGGCLSYPHLSQCCSEFWEKPWQWVKLLGRQHFHLHLISDATGETLIAASRAAAAQYEGVTSIEHVYPLVRSRAQLDKAIDAVEAAPGIVLFTLVDQELANRLESACKELSVPCLSVLQPVLNLFQSYIGAASMHRPGAQHMLNSEYFKRIEALNFTMLHDDGQQIENFEAADVVLLGVSRTSKTPTSIYLANRGIKTANIPIVPDIPLPDPILALHGPLVVGLIASIERIVQVRENRLLALKTCPDSPYVDRFIVAGEVARARRLCAEHGWPIIDVTHRSIEETAAAVIDFYKIHQLKFIASP